MGRLLVIDEVLRELEKQEDELHRWISQRPKMLVLLDGTLQQRAGAIINRFPSLANTKSIMGGAADPFVIALAKERNLTVVTAEKPKPSKPRIPDVCGRLGIPCIALVEMFRREGWRV